MNRLIYILFLTLCAGMASAQRMVPDVHDLGRVKLYNNPTLIYTFTNESKVPVLFMPTPYMMDLEVSIPEGYVQPGQSIQIKVRYFTEKYGMIRVHQPIYINSRNDPFYINITGKIISFHPNALTMCPSMNKSEADVKREQSGSSTITTYDKTTGMTIQGVNLLFSGRDKQFLIENSKNPMVTLEDIPIGLYEIEVSKQGYRTAEEVFYINRGGGHFVIELEPFDTTEVIVPEEQFAQAEETEAEQESVDEEEEVFVLEEVDEREEEGIDRIRRKIREQYKDLKIIERDVVLIDKDEERIAEDTTVMANDIVPVQEDTTIIDPLPVEVLPDFDPDGRLSAKYAKNNIVFLIDVSSSMKNPDKLPLLKESMKNMVSVLRPGDVVTIITYASSTKIALRPIQGDRKNEIYEVIDSLKAFGYSKGADGMGMAYEQALKNLILDGNNQIILATDGLFNSTDLVEEDLYDMAQEHSQEKNIRLSVVAFGKSRSALSFMKDLSAKGQGSYIRIDPDSGANKELVIEIMKNALK